MDPSDLEKAYAEALGVPAVILLPSVRAGIHMVIQAMNKPGMIVVGPAYTCHTVHEALALSGACTRLVDSAPGSFLMSPDAIYAATEPGCALVLSEVYGIPYDQEMLRNACRKRAPRADPRHGHEHPWSGKNAATGGQGRCAVQFRVGQTHVRGLGRHRMFSGSRTCRQGPRDTGPMDNPGIIRSSISAQLFDSSPGRYESTAPLRAVA